MQFKYSGKTSSIFQSIGIDLKGKITKDNLKLNYSLEKKEGKNSGKFKITVDQIKITDFYRLFSNNREMTDNDAVDDNSLTDATITDPIIEGTRDEQGNTEIIMAGRVFDSSLFGKNKFGEIYRFYRSEGLGNFCLIFHSILRKK